MDTLVATDPQAESKDAAYREAAAEIASVVAGEGDVIARMASVCALLADRFEHYFWTGFYRVDPAKPDELVIGPYQGTLGCLRIAFGRGVCGTAAARRETLIVPDVHAFSDHIACDSRSQSEIVVPVVDADGRLIAVFDVDATTLAAFDAVDARGLEAIMRQTFAG